MTIPGVRVLAGVFIAGVMATGAPERALAEQICVEMVASVCLKYREAPKPAAPKPKTQPAPSAAPLSPAAREERALQLSRGELREVQAGLRAGGYYDGPLDGAIGPGSRRGISRWQSANDRDVTGYLTFDQVKAIRALTAPAAPSPEIAAPAPSAPTPEAAPAAPALQPAPGQVYRTSADAPPPEAWRSTMTMRIEVKRRDDETATISMDMSGETKFAFDKECVVKLNEPAECEFAGPFRSGNTWILRGQLPTVSITNTQVAFNKTFTFW